MIIAKPDFQACETKTKMSQMAGGISDTLMQARLQASTPTSSPGFLSPTIGRPDMRSHTSLGLRTTTNLPTVPSPMSRWSPSPKSHVTVASPDAYNELLAGLPRKNKFKRAVNAVKNTVGMPFGEGNLLRPSDTGKSLAQKKAKQRMEMRRVLAAKDAQLQHELLRDINVRLVKTKITRREEEEARLNKIEAFEAGFVQDLDTFLR